MIACSLLLSVCIHANRPLGIQGYCYIVRIFQKAGYVKKARWTIRLAPNHCRHHGMEGADCANHRNDDHIVDDNEDGIKMRLWMIWKLDLLPGVLLQCEAGWEEDWKG
jgi:hypothetical protein